MGAEAKIIGFGPYKKEYLESEGLLPYGNGYYDNVEEGTIIIVEFCNCNTTAQSEELATVCAADLRDFSTHYLNRGQGIAMWGLEDMVEHSGIAEWGEEEIYHLDRLIKTGDFRFFLQPNM